MGNVKCLGKDVGMNVVLLKLSWALSVNYHY